MNNKLLLSAIVGSLLLLPCTPYAADLNISARGDSSYISEGVNNLSKGGIFWGSAEVEYEQFSSYLDFGRADQVDYKEMKAGFTYSQPLINDLSVTLGYERVEVWGEEREGDNDLNLTFDYSGVHWVTPEVYYSYSTEAKGYFVQLSLIGNWALANGITIAPYATQIFDFGSINENTSGANNVEIGIDATYQFSKKLILGGMLAHSFAQSTLKTAGQLEANKDLDQTYVGLSFTWQI